MFGRPTLTLRNRSTPAEFNALNGNLESFVDDEEQELEATKVVAQTQQQATKKVDEVATTTVASVHNVHAENALSQHTLQAEEAMKNILMADDTQFNKLNAAVAEAEDNLRAAQQNLDAYVNSQRDKVAEQLKDLAAQYNIPASAIYGRSIGGAMPRKTGTGKGTGPRGPVAAKYRNDKTGETWSGRGRQPKWLVAAIAAGKKPEDFAL